MMSSGLEAVRGGERGPAVPRQLWCSSLQGRDTVETMPTKDVLAFSVLNFLEVDLFK